MTIVDESKVQERVQTFLEFYQAAEDMARQRFRREDPSHSDDEIHRRVVEWRLQSRTKSLPGCIPSRRTFE